MSGSVGDEAGDIIECRGLCKDYHLGSETIHALRDVDLTIARADFVAIMGPSGSGKSTLMNLLGALDVPTKGQLIIDGQDIGALTADELAEFRNHTVGFVFQQFNLLSRASALSNVKLPLLYSEVPLEERDARAAESLEHVGLSDRADHHPNQLSGGQQQRVAIARALVNQPSILLADEPTGALDTETGHEILKIFASLNRDHGITIILVTHEREVADEAHRQIIFRDGRIMEDRRTNGQKAGA